MCVDVDALDTIERKTEPHGMPWSRIFRDEKKLSGLYKLNRATRIPIKIVQQYKC